MNDNPITLITGSNSGIGKETAIALAKEGHEIIMVSRDSEKSHSALNEIKEKSSNRKIHLYTCDLASLKSIKDVAVKIGDDFTHINILINNAGLFKTKYEESSDGFEMTMAVNYFAPFYLTNLLSKLLRKQPNSRIINLSSDMYKRGKVTLNTLEAQKSFNSQKTYANSKMLINYFTLELAHRLKDETITVNALHPGVVSTDVFRDYPQWFNNIFQLFISKPEEGAKPSIYLASSEEVSDLTGKYFSKFIMKPMENMNLKDEFLKALWDKTEEIIQKSI